MAEGDNAVESIEGAANEKVAGLPVWAWLLIVAGGAVVVFLVLPKVLGGGSAPAAGGSPLLGGGSGGGLGGGGGTTGPTTGGTTGPTGPTTNADWLTQAVTYATTTFGISTAEATAWLQAYLSGSSLPGVSSSNASLFQKLITGVTESLGAPPNGVPTASATPAFSTFQQWLSVAEGIIGGIPSGVNAEYQALLSGQTTQLSTTADSYLRGLQDVLGTAPSLPAYTVIGGPANPPPPPGGSPSVLHVLDSDIINAISSWSTLPQIQQPIGLFNGIAAYGPNVTDTTGAQAIARFFVPLQQSITNNGSTLGNGGLLAIWNYWQQNGGTAQQIAAWINQNWTGLQNSGLPSAIYFKQGGKLSTFNYSQVFPQAAMPNPGGQKY